MFAAGFLFLAITALVNGAALADDTTIELESGWRFQPDPDHRGEADSWFATDYADAAWAVIDAGKKWEDQGFADLDGHAWYRKWVEVPASWRKKDVWVAFGGVNDSYTLYCNGSRVGAYGDKDTYSTAKMGTSADLTSFLRPGERNLIAVDVYDWALSGGIWRLPCILTIDPAKLPEAILVEGYRSVEDEEVIVQILPTGLGAERPDIHFTIDLCLKGRAKPVQTNTEVLTPDQSVLYTTFHVRGAKKPLEYICPIEGRAKNGSIVPGTVAVAGVEWTGEARPAAAYKDAKVLNNFVVELLNKRCSQRGDAEFVFTNPREGWVFVSLDSPRQGKEPASLSGPKAHLDHDGDALVWRPYPETGALEAMRRLAEGKHRLRLTGAEGMRLVVRSIPELIFCYYPLKPALPEQAAYDWDYMTRHVLSNVNGIVTHPGTPLSDEEIDQWSREGRNWVARAPLAGLHQPEPPTAEAVYANWRDSVGTTDPRFGGVIVDEFINSGTIDYYKPWAAGLELLGRDPNFEGKTFYAWCGLMARHEATAPFRPVIMKHGYRFVWEQYMPEQAGLAAARCYLLRRYVSHSRLWENKDPGAGPHIIQCPALFCAPPSTVNLNPGADYRVYLDMQFRIMATEPALWGQAGVLPWTANYADEDVVRWISRLERHYCIEGRRAPMSQDPYLLPHLQNADFDEGLAGWTAAPAMPGAITAEYARGFGASQGRYGMAGAGDHFLLLRQSPDGPNCIRQPVKALTPGRLYSLKLIVTDLAHPAHEGVLPVSVQLDDAEVRDGLSHVSRYDGRTLVDEEGKSIHPDFDYHRMIFAATAPETTLTIADQLGSEGRELAINFVELQPYDAP